MNYDAEDAAYSYEDKSKRKTITITVSVRELNALEAAPKELYPAILGAALRTLTRRIQNAYNA